MDDKLADLEVRTTGYCLQLSLTFVVPLQREYCPPIDTSLFSAILLDYDLSDFESCKALCAVLDELKGSALAEETASFDPSGSSRLQEDTHVPGDPIDLASSWHGETGSSSGTTENTELTSTSRSLDGVRLEEIPNVQVSKALSNEEKVLVLEEMFPEAKAFDVEWTFKKARYDFDKAVGELLNQAFLGESMNTGDPLVKRGIEGFSESITGIRRKKKGKKLPAMTDFSPEGTSTYNPSSRWDRMKGDIDFLEQRTFIPRDIISSKYHRSGANLSTTITTLCASEEQDANPYITYDTSTLLETHAIDLAPEFPTLSYAQILALVRLSHPSTASARELGRALLSSPPSDSASKILPQYLPRPPSPNEISTSNSASTSVRLEPSTAVALADRRGVSFSQAQSAYRKSKSNPQFGGAAAYYSQVGRDASAALRRHEAAAADELVASQSKSGEVDLHGVNARDAVRIARARLSDWWDHEAQEWSRTGKSKGDFRIVTGQGLHSTGGKGVLGPTVFKALVGDGWKVRMEQGCIVVSGKVSKRA